MADVKQGGAAGDGTRADLVRSEAGAGARGAAGQALAMVSQVQQRVMALPPQRRNMMLGMVLFLGAACAGLMWFWQRPDWRVLFSGLDAKDVQTVSQELAAAGIPFSTTPDGSGVQVPADAMDKARMEVAAKGMPQSGRLGFELFDKPNWVGSEFDERVNYQRALEGELEHTIGSLGAVRAAHVHLSMPQPSLFTTEDKAAKASVVLKLRKTSLSDDQIEAIRSLVAGAVESLTPENVTLVDADGRANLRMKGHGSAAEGEVEDELQQKLLAVLGPLAGSENVRATVNVTYDDSHVETTDEIYDPNQVVQQTRQHREQTSGVKQESTGIPGTVSNAPGPAPAGSAAAAGAAVAGGTPALLKPALPVYPSAGGPGTQTIEDSVTNDVTRHVTHSEVGPGRVKRVTAAVVVNDKPVVEGTGKTEHTVWKPRSAEELKHMEQLAQAAIGFDDKRGDQVVMSNVSFQSNAPDTKLTGAANVVDQVKTFAQTQPGLMRTGMMGMMGLLVVMLVMRPVAKQLTASLQAPVVIGAGAQAGYLSERSYEVPVASGGGSASLGEGSHQSNEASGVTPTQQEQPAAPRRRQMKQGQVMFEHVADQIVKEPVQSTRLLETWIGSGEGD